MTADAFDWVLDGSFTLRIEMRSDWHVGTGAGRPGDVDRLIARDADGLPHVPAKTAKGLWRHACEGVARALDEGSPGPWTDWCLWLFGTQPGRDPGADRTQPPQAGALEVRSALLPDALRGAMRELPPTSPLRQAITFVKPGVRIDPSTGRAEDDHLRFVEMARGGVTLSAPCSLPPGLDPAHAAAASALLHAGARLFDRLGSDRRRGAGRCVVTAQPSVPAGTAPPHASLEQVWSWLEETRAPAPPPLTRGEDGGSGRELAEARGIPPTAEPWWTVPLVLHLRTPLLASVGRRGAVTLVGDHIPGAVLLALLARTFRDELDISGLVRRNEIVVLPATPAGSNGERGRPVPLSWYVPKTRPVPDDDSGAQVVNRLDTPGPEGVPLKQLREGYVGSGAGRWSARKAMTAHNSIDDATQRTEEGAGSLYTYSALAAGQTFRAEVRLPASVARTVRWARLTGPHAVGRSKRDSYGAVDVSTEAPRPVAPWPSAPPPSGGRLTVWVQSTVLLRDERLRPDPSLGRFGQVLGEALGVSLAPAPPHPEGTVGHALRRAREDGWHVGWGLPRPSLVGIAPGSCATFTVSGSIDRARWDAVCVRGIGERTAEGYGQVALDDPLLAGTPPSERPVPLKSPGPSGPAPSHHRRVGRNDEGEAYARIIERAAWRARIRDAAHLLADDAKLCYERMGFDHSASTPSRAQAGTLRAVAARLARDPLAGGVWCAHVRNTPSRQGRWPAPVLTAFERLTVRADAVVWRLLGLEDPASLALCEGDPREELWAEAVLALVEACARAHTRRLQERESGEEAHGRHG